ncbi:MAG: hypothetical protein JJU20_06220 [Opitutales bacterium]|nr:hypothetical protein [Opitutales bacterium]
MRSLHSMVHTSKGFHTVSWSRLEASADWQPESMPRRSASVGRLSGGGSVCIRVDTELRIRNPSDLKDSCSYSQLQLGGLNWNLEFDRVLERSRQEHLCPLPAALAGLYQDSSVLLSVQAGFLYLNASVGCLFGWNRERPHWRLFSLSGERSEQVVRQAFAMWLSGFEEGPVQLYTFFEDQSPFENFSLPLEMLEWRGFHPLHLGSLRAWTDLDLQTRNTRIRSWKGRRFALPALAAAMGAVAAGLGLSGWAEIPENEAAAALAISLPYRVVQALQNADSEQQAVQLRRLGLMRALVFAEWVERVENKWQGDENWTLTFRSGERIELRRTFQLPIDGRNEAAVPDWLDREILEFEVWMESLLGEYPVSIRSEWQERRGLILQASFIPPALAAERTGYESAIHTLPAAAPEQDLVSLRELRERVAKIRKQLRESGVRLEGDPHLGWGRMLRQLGGRDASISIPEPLVASMESLAELISQAPGIESVELKSQLNAPEQTVIAADFRMESAQLAALLSRVATKDLQLSPLSLQVHSGEDGTVRLRTEWHWIPTAIGSPSPSSFAGAFRRCLPDWVAVEVSGERPRSSAPLPVVLAAVTKPGSLSLRGTFIGTDGRPLYILQNSETEEWLTLVAGQLCDHTGVLAGKLDDLPDQTGRKGVELYWPKTGRKERLFGESEPLRIAHASVECADGESVIWVCGEVRDVGEFQLRWRSNTGDADVGGLFEPMQLSQR